MVPSREITRLIEIMAALRTPKTGCPWDLQQTFATIAPYTIEEAYEVADAIDRSDMEDLCDEFGDLLLQVAFHARMAQEEGAFNFGDVVYAVTDKLVRRHPHVFGTEDAEALLQMLIETPAARLDWRPCNQLHTAVAQIVLAAGPEVEGPCGDAWVEKWLSRGSSDRRKA